MQPATPASLRQTGADRWPPVVRNSVSTLGSFIWSIADQLRGPYRPNQYGTVILPFTILRRLDCVLEPDRAAVRELAARYENPNRLKVEVKKATGRTFYNTSNYEFANLLADAGRSRHPDRPG